MEPREAMKKFCTLLGTCSPELAPWMEAQQKEKEEKERMRKEEEERLRREAEEAAERERQRLLQEEMRRKAEEEEEERYTGLNVSIKFWCANFTYLLFTECKVHSECLGQKSPLKKGGSVTYNTN